MRLDAGWLDCAEQCVSPNCDERPADTAISLLVLHNISLPPGQYGGSAVAEFFTNRLDCDSHPQFASLRGVRVSAHLLLRRNGSWIQFVPFGLRAWHAGVSCWQGAERCNDYSIGIELEGTDSDPYCEVQYGSLLRVIRLLARAYPITDVVGHCDIAPGRKTDPGAAFDWRRIDGWKSISDQPAVR